MWRKGRRKRKRERVRKRQRKKNRTGREGRKGKERKRENKKKREEERKITRTEGGGGIEGELAQETAPDTSQNQAYSLRGQNSKVL